MRYAVRISRRPETDLAIIETVAAGQFPARRLVQAEATRIFTGAPLPQGADTVIRQEDTAQPSRPTSRFAMRATRKRTSGAVARTFARAVGRAARRHDARSGAARRAGVDCYDAPLVHRRPRVAFMGSGDEIVELEQRDAILAGTKIASSNSYTLDALIRRASAEPVNLGIARDSKESLREHLRGAAGTDLLVTTAGVSVGEHDLVRTVLEELGRRAEAVADRDAARCTVGFGLLHGVPWIGLPAIR